MYSKIITIALIFTPMIQDTTKQNTTLPPKEAATVEQEKGVFLFISCKPQRSYKYLGNIKQGTMSFNPYENILGKCKKDYPQADGLIFHTATLLNADVIMFDE